MTDFADLAFRVDTSDLKKGERAQDSFGRKSEQTERKTTKATAAISSGFRRMVPAIAAAIAALGAGAGFAAAIREAEKFQTTMLRVEAVIKATGGAAGRSADQLRQQARELARGTLESTEGVLRAQQTLLTFRKVQGDVFDRAIVAAADMTAALGGDLNSATLQLAKALENPLEGISALSRSGTVFTAAQKDMVRAMVEAGQTAEAQAFILDELEAQYKGTAEAAAGGLAGAQDTLSQSMQEFRLELSDSLGLLTLATAANNAAADAVNWLAENIDGARGFIIAAALGLTAYYTPAILAATFQTGLFIGSLITLRGALIASGIGAFVVGAGLLINKFLELVEGAAGFGNAMRLLGDVAAGVWDKVVAGGSLLVAELRIKMNDIAFSWTKMVGEMNMKWGQFVDKVASTKLGQDLGITSGNELAAIIQMNTSLSDLTDTMTVYQGQARDARTVLQAPISGMNELRDAANGASDAIANGGTTSVVGAMAEANEAAVDLGSASSGALKKTIETADAATTAFQDFAKDGIGKAVDWMVGGFKGGLNTLKDMFLNALRQMIATAAKNKIMISLGMGGSGIGGMAQAGSGMLGGGGGMLGALGAFGSSVGTGLSVVGSGFAAGGFGGAATAGLGAVTGGIGAGGAVGLGTALGAAIPFIGAAALAIGLFSKKTKELDSGLKVVIEGFDATAETFRKIETSRFFGLSKSTSTRSTNDPDNPVLGAVADIQTAIAEAANVLGFGANIFDQFAFDFKLSLKGLTEDQKLAKINEQLALMGDEFASLVPGMASMTDVINAANQAVMDAGQLGATRFESQMLMAARRRGEFTVAGAGDGGTRTEDLIRLRSMDDANKTTADNTAKQSALMERLLRIWERFEIDGVPQGPVVG